jgi:hypothetical protein
MNKWSRHKNVASLYMMNNKDTLIVRDCTNIILTLWVLFYFHLQYFGALLYLVYPSCFSFRVI